MRIEPSDSSEMVNQVLYGEFFKVLEIRKKWSRIRLAHDDYEGWIDNNQYNQIEEEAYQGLSPLTPKVATDLVQLIHCPDKQLVSIPMGAQVNSCHITGDSYEGRSTSGPKEKYQLLNTALLYLKSPYLWGGRTPFGLDCSGFTQMVYRLNGHKLLRDASQQAAQGEALSFIEESEPGDLAFFDNSEGAIVHVGIIMPDNHIIHCHGEVRIDYIDHTGIFNKVKGKHTHKLRVIKRIV